MIDNIKRFILTSIFIVGLLLFVTVNFIMKGLKNK